MSRSIRALAVKPLCLMFLCLVAKASLADSVDAYARELLKKQHVVGLSLAVVKDGRIVKVGGYGFANIETKTPARPGTVYKIASVSKQFFASAVMLLVGEGKIRLDDKANISTRLPIHGRTSQFESYLAIRQVLSKIRPVSCRSSLRKMLR